MISEFFLFCMALIYFGGASPVAGLTLGTLGISFLFFLFGGLLFSLTASQCTLLSRVGYLLWSSLILCALVLLHFFGTPLIMFLIGGSLSWLLFPILAVKSAVLGAMFFAVASARSCDCSGDPDKSLLSLIPLGNLYFLFTPSLDRKSASFSTGCVSSGYPTLMGDVFASFLGISLIVWAVGMNLYAGQERFGFWSSPELQAPVQQGDSASRPIEVALATLIQQRGLEGALQVFARETKVPVPIDELTTMVRVESEGKTFHRLFVVQVEQEIKFTEEVRKQSAQVICSVPMFALILRSGGKIQDTYFNKAGQQAGVLQVTGSTCGF